MKDLKKHPFSFLIGMALGIIFVGIIALYIIDVHACTVDEINNERTIEIFPEPVTLVEITILPTFVEGLAEGDPDPEPPTVPNTIAYVKPAEGTLSKSAGRVQGPTNEETYYNLPMSKVVQSMRNRGYSEEDYPYWVREDGVKMLGEYVIVAADLNLHPKGTVVETSLGQGLVCDTGEFTEDIYDIATDW